MARPVNPVPTYRLHRQSGQAVVTLRLPDGRRKDILLGAYKSPESRAEYRRIIAEIEAGLPGTVPLCLSPDLTVNELLLSFLRHAEQHYRRPDGTMTDEVKEYKLVFRIMKDLYGHSLAREFGPLALKAVREQMVKGGLCRSLINQRVGRVRRVFKWSAGEELLPFDVYHRLTAVQGLLKGRSNVRESAPVEPVAEEHVWATMPYVRPTVAAMVELQLLTGMRPGEVCTIRPCELDTTGPVWTYKPDQHKTAWRGKRRVIAVGPRAQALLEAHWPAASTDYFFSPRRAVAELHAKRTKDRKTPWYPSHQRNRQKSGPVRSPEARYSTSSYGRAIARGVIKANERRERMAGQGNFDPVPHWHPNQCRHTAGTDVRKRYGLEAAQAFLGHDRADVTQVYAERIESLAAKVASEVG
jgi:integrase